ncbi:MAG: hypothetical protein PVI24_17625 [Myxococcales bacterium]|jgi:hypothetical protein
MTLPQPYEVEQDELSPRAGAPPERLDVEHLMGQLIVVDPPYVDIAGCRLRTPEGESPESVAELFRTALAERFLERRPHADEATWNRFASSLRAVLSNESEASQAALSEALLLIDGL